MVLALPSRADVIVGDGAEVTLGDGTLGLSCRALRISGTLRGGSGTIRQGGDYEILPGGILAAEGATLEVAGDWNNLGTFEPGGSTVHFLDGCDRDEAAICDTTTFANLVVESAMGKTYEFEVGATQTVLDSLVVNGDDGARVLIRSKQAGQRAFIDLRGDQEIAFVDVRDHEAVRRRIGTRPAEDLASIDSGNTVNWFIDLDAALMPATSAPALIVGLLAMLLIARSRLRADEQGVRHD
jgi:hypothetical protein